MSSIAARAADLPREPLGSARSRQHAELDFGKADLPAVLFRDAQIRGESDFEASAHGMPIERRNDQLRRLFQPVQRLVRMKAEGVLEARRRAVEHVDVGARAEELLPGAAQNDHVNRVVHAGVEYRRVELFHHLVAVGIGRRGMKLQ